MPEVPRFTPDQWHQVGVRLMNRKKGETFKTIAADFSLLFGRTLSERTLRNARHRFRAHKRMHGKPGPKKGEGGAKRYMSEAQCNQVDALVEEHQDDHWDYTALDLKDDLGAPAGTRGPWSRTYTLKDGTQELRHHGPATMSERACNMLFERKGYKAYVPENRERYNDVEKQKRVAFAEAFKDYTAADWRAMFFTDEHGVYFSRGRTAERQLRGRKQKVRHKKGEGQKESCCRSKNGPNTRGGTRIGLHVTFCNGKAQYGVNKTLLASQKYTQFAWAKVIKKIGKFARQANGLPGFPTVRGIQDNLTAHWAPGARSAMAENRVRFLPRYPPRSPDLNPIENVFPHLDKFLAKLQKEHGDAADQAAFLLRVDAFFAQASLRTLLERLADSMPARLAKVIELHGAATGN